MTAEPSKRAKSMAAMERFQGRRGGRRLPLITDFEQAEAFGKAVDEGAIVYAECLCSYLWLARCDLGAACDHCGGRYSVADVERSAAG